LQAAQEHSNLNAASSVINVCLIQHEELPVFPSRAIKEFAILWAKQQVFQHSIVCKQYVRRRNTHSGSAHQLIAQKWLLRVLFSKTIFSFSVLFFCLACIASKGNRRVIGQNTS